MHIITPRIANTCIYLVRRSILDHSAPPGLRQRPDQPAAAGRDGQRQPGQGRQGPRGLEAPANELLLHLQQDVDQGQERIWLDHYEC